MFAARSGERNPVGRTVLICLAAGALVAAFPGDVRGGLITFELCREFSGGTWPEGTPPWLTATFDDGGSAGNVTLTLVTANLTGTEYVCEWTFNLDPALDPTALSFAQVSKTGSFTDPQICLAADAYKANGDGKFDIQLAFETGDGGSVRRFGAGDAVQYAITGIPTLTTDSFNFLCELGGGRGRWPTAAHVQSIGADRASGWVTVPEPAALALLALGFLGLAARRPAKRGR